MNCPICFELIDDLIKLECNHSFCKNCINKWRQNANTCPCCRKNINLEKESSIYGTYQGCSIIEGNLYGFRPTLSKYLSDEKILSCTENGHQFVINKPYGILINCQTCNKDYCFNWKN